MKKPLAFLILLPALAFAQSPVYESQDADVPSGMSGAFTPAFEDRLIAVYGLNDPDDLGLDSRGGFDLTPQNSPTATGGAKDLAPDFVGTNYASWDQLQSGANDYTFRIESNIDFGICFWYEPDTATNNHGVIEHGLNADYAFIHMAGPNLGWWLKDTLFSTKIAQVSITLNRRQYVCGWYDATEQRGYISVDDGTPVASDVLTGGIRTIGNGDFVVGARGNGSNPCDGAIAGVAFYKGGIPPASTLYASGLGQKYSETSGPDRTNLLGWWEMDQASGDFLDAHSTRHLVRSATIDMRPGLVARPDSGTSIRPDSATDACLYETVSALSAGEDWSLAGWVFNDSDFATTQSVGSLGITGIWPDGTAGALYITSSGNTAACAVGDGDSYAIRTRTSVTSIYCDKCWVHLACTFDWSEKNIRLFVNGQESTTAMSGTGLDGTPVTQSAIGVAAYRDVSAGCGDTPTDEVKLWARDIGAEGVALDYADGEGRFW